MISNSEFPRIGKKDGNHFSGSEPGGNKATGKGFNQTSIFAERETAVAGGVN
jgi:hypothetical protein